MTKLHSITHLARRSRFARLVLGTVAVAAITLLVGQARAVPVLIDDFIEPITPTDPNTPGLFFIMAVHPNPYMLKQPDPGALGTERDIFIDVLGVAGPISSAGVIGGGIFQIATASPASTIHLQYDGIDFGDAAGAPDDAMGLPVVDLTGAGMNAAFAFDFLSLDGGPGTPGVSLDMFLTAPGGTATLSTDFIPESGTPFTHVVNFAAFVTAGTFDFTDVTSINVMFNLAGDTDIDFELDTFGTTIPEPTSALLALFGAALSLVMCGRRRRRA